MKNKEMVNIGNFYMQDGSKENMHERLTEMLEVATINKTGEVIPSGEGSFAIVHPDGFETVCGIVECADRGKPEYKIEVTFNEHALPAQYYQNAFDILARSTFKDGDGFTLESFVVSDKEQVEQSSGPMPDSLHDTYLTDVFSVKNKYRFKNNVSVVKTSYKMNEQVDNKWVLRSIAGALSYLDGFHLTDVERAKIVSNRIREEKYYEMER